MDEIREMEMMNNEQELNAAVEQANTMADMYAPTQVEQQTNKPGIGKVIAAGTATAVTLAAAGYGVVKGGKALWNWGSNKNAERKAKKEAKKLEEARKTIAEYDEKLKAAALAAAQAQASIPQQEENENK